MSKIAVINEFSIEAVKDALQKLDTFENLKVNGLNAQQFTEIEAIEPELFAQISKMVKNGRWNPFVGTWTDSNELSATALIKSCLYSERYFLDKFGKKYRVFKGKRIYNELFPQILYSSLFDAAILDCESETKWVHGADDFRTLVMSAELLDINDMDDDFIVKNEFATFEEFCSETFDSHLHISTDFLPKGDINCSGIEKLLIDAEKSTTLCGVNARDKVKAAWLSYLGGDCEAAETLANKITADNDYTAFDFQVHGDGIEITEIKFAENSNDIVIRVAEKDGKEKSAYIMCNKLNAGFRFEILPYEIQTFKILNDGKGYVKEIYICE